MCGPGGAQGVVDATDVHGHGPVEDPRIAADERQLRRDTRVGDDDVEAAQRGDGSGDDLVDLGAVGDVAGPVRRVDLGRDLRQQLGLEAGQRDVRAPFVEAPSEGRADAARGSGDQDTTTAQHPRTLLERNTRVYHFQITPSLTSTLPRVALL